MIFKWPFFLEWFYSIPMCCLLFECVERFSVWQKKANCQSKFIKDGVISTSVLGTIHFVMYFTLNYFLCHLFFFLSQVFCWKAKKKKMKIIMMKKKRKQKKKSQLAIESFGLVCTFQRKIEFWIKLICWLNICMLRRLFQKKNLPSSIFASAKY